MLNRLASLRRFSMEQLSHSESVLEHTGFVAVMALAIASELNDIKPGSIDIKAVLIKAIVHDFDEVVTGDIPRPTKYSSLAAVKLFDEIKLTSIEKICGRLNEAPGFSSSLRTHHVSAKDGQEGIIVAIADLLAVVYMVWREVIMHSNMSMIRQAYTVVDQIDKARECVVEEFRGPSKNFLLDLLDQAITIADTAASRELAVHATFREDLP